MCKNLKLHQRPHWCRITKFFLLNFFLGNSTESGGEIIYWDLMVSKKPALYVLTRFTPSFTLRASVHFDRYGYPRIWALDKNFLLGLYIFLNIPSKWCFIIQATFVTTESSDYQSIPLEYCLPALWAYEPPDVQRLKHNYV